MRCTTTRSSRLQQFGLLVCLGLLLAAAGAQRAAAQSVSVTTTSPTPPATIAAVPGLPVSITANAAFTDVPLAANETRVGGTSLSYAWSGSSPFTTSPDGSSATFTPSFGAPGTNKLTLTCTVTYSETIDSTDPDSASPTGTIVTPTVINGAQAPGSVDVIVVAVNPVVTITSAPPPDAIQDCSFGSPDELTAIVSTLPGTPNQKWTWTIGSPLYSSTGKGPFVSDGSELGTVPVDDDSMPDVYLTGVFSSTGWYQVSVQASVTLTDPDTNAQAGPFTSALGYIGGGSSPNLAGPNPQGASDAGAGVPPNPDFDVGAPALSISLDTQTVPLNGTIKGTVSISISRSYALVNTLNVYLMPLSLPSSATGRVSVPLLVGFFPGETSATFTVTGGAVSSAVGDVDILAVDDDFNLADETATCFSLTSSVIPAANFAGRSLTSFGVGEDIGLVCAAIPKGASLPGLKWTASGAGILTDDGHVTGTGEYWVGASADAPTFGMVITDGDAAGTSFPGPQISVIAPTSQEARDTLFKDFHITGDASSGFVGAVSLLPNNVSFTNVMWTEVDCYAASSHGDLSGSKTVLHFPGSVGDTNWLQIGWDDTLGYTPTKGTQDSEDKITVDVSPDPNPKNPPFAGGDCEYDVPWEYKVLTPTGSYSSPVSLATMAQKASDKASGEALTSKGSGSSDTALTADQYTQGYR